MTKEEFLNDKNVAGFIQWFSHKLSDFPYSYYTCLGSCRQPSILETHTG